MAEDKRKKQIEYDKELGDDAVRIRSIVPEGATEKHGKPLRPRYRVVGHGQATALVKTKRWEYADARYGGSEESSTSSGSVASVAGDAGKKDLTGAGGGKKP